MFTPYKSASMRSAVLALVALACGDGAGPADPATPATLALTTAPPASAQNRVTLDPQPVVQLRDANGGAVAQAGTVINAAITAAGGTLGGSTTATTASTGAATFTDLSIAGTAGEKTLTFSAPGLTSATATLTLTAGSVASIAAVAGNNQFADPGIAVATAPAVRVADVDGNGVSGVAVTFAVDSGGGLITGATQTTDPAGVATVGSWTLGPAAGSNSLIATAEGLTGVSVTFKANGIVADPCRRASSSTIALEATVSGMLEPPDCIFHGGQFHDFYNFTLASQQAVLLSLRSEDFDPTVELFTFIDQRDRGIRSDTVDVRRNATLKAILAPGRYETAASSQRVGATGPYTLQVSVTSPAVESCEVVFVVRGINTTQQLASTDCVDNTERFYGDIFTLWLEAGERVMLTQSSTELEPLLQLYRGSGDLVAATVGITPGTAALDFEADATDSYFVVATSAQFLQSGGYTLSISDPSTGALTTALARDRIQGVPHELTHEGGMIAHQLQRKWRR
jgi:hypothetical protein